MHIFFPIQFTYTILLYCYHMIKKKKGNNKENIILKKKNIYIYIIYINNN